MHYCVPVAIMARNRPLRHREVENAPRKERLQVGRRRRRGGGGGGDGEIATTSALAALGTVSCTYSGNSTPDPLMALGPEQASCLGQMVVKETNEANETNEAKEARERPEWSGPPRKARKHSLWQLAGVEVRTFRGRDTGSVPAAGRFQGRDIVVAGRLCEAGTPVRPGPMPPLA